MKDYGDQLKAHLAEYMASRLGVAEAGVYGKKAHPHILPASLFQLNVLEQFRAEFWRDPRSRVDKHRGFHHLNSSQAFAFNLFFPLLADRAGGRALTGLLSAPTEVTNFEFEFSAWDRTSVDVAWWSGDRVTFCEVKLSETKFGSATSADSATYQRRLDTIYAKPLSGLVDPALLELGAFRENYQLLRNVALLADARTDAVVFLVPRANQALKKPLTGFREMLLFPAKERVHVAFIEDVLQQLRDDAELSPAFRQYAAALIEKYVP